MITVRSKEELNNHISSALKKSRCFLLSVDGLTGSGKSTLAYDLSKHFGFTLIDLDDDRYLDKKKGGYTNFIKYENLLADILKNKTKETKIISGVCIQEILSRIKITPGLKIYIKKMKTKNYWYDGECLDYTKDVEEVIENYHEIIKRFSELILGIENNENESSSPNESVYDEIIRYHFNYRPEEEADIVFERLNSE